MKVITASYVLQRDYNTRSLFLTLESSTSLMWALDINKGSQPGPLGSILAGIIWKEFFDSLFCVRREDLNNCISLCNQLRSQDLEHFCHPGKLPYLLGNPIPP